MRVWNAASQVTTAVDMRVAGVRYHSWNRSVPLKPEESTEHGGCALAEDIHEITQGFVSFDPFLDLRLRSTGILGSMNIVARSTLSLSRCRQYRRIWSRRLRFTVGGGNRKRLSAFVCAHGFKFGDAPLLQLIFCSLNARTRIDFVLGVDLGGFRANKIPVR